MKFLVVLAVLQISFINGFSQIGVIGGLNTSITRHYNYYYTTENDNSLARNFNEPNPIIGLFYNYNITPLEDLIFTLTHNISYNSTTIQFFDDQYFNGYYVSSFRLGGQMNYNQLSGWYYNVGFGLNSFYFGEFGYEDDIKFFHSKLEKIPLPDAKAGFGKMFLKKSVRVELNARVGFPFVFKLNERIKATSPFMFDLCLYLQQPSFKSTTSSPLKNPKRKYRTIDNCPNTYKKYQ